MTIEDFKKQVFSSATKVRYKDGAEYAIASVDFDEYLICLCPYYDIEDEDNYRWVRCENCEIINPC